LTIHDVMMSDYDDELDGTDFEKLFPSHEDTPAPPIKMAHFCEIYKILDSVLHFN